MQKYVNLRELLPRSLLTPCRALSHPHIQNSARSRSWPSRPSDSQAPSLSFSNMQVAFSHSSAWASGLREASNHAIKVAGGFLLCPYDASGSSFEEESQTSLASETPTIPEHPLCTTHRTCDRYLDPDFKLLASSQPSLPPPLSSSSSSSSSIEANSTRNHKLHP